MANITPTIADTSGFIPEVWAQRALDVLKGALVLARLVTKDAAIEPGWLGKTLNIPYPGKFTAQDKAPDTAAALQVPTGGATVAVTLDKHKHVDFLVEDVAQAQANQRLLDRYVQPAALAIAEAIEADLFALYAGLSQTVGSASAAMDAGTVLAARQALNAAKIPAMPRYLVLSPADEVALLSDAALANFFAFSRQAAIANGSIGTLYGFDVYMSQYVPSAGGSYKNLAFHPEAFILATRPFRDPPTGSGVAASTVTDPDTGLVMRVLYAYDMAYRGVRVGLDVLYGVAELRDAAGVVVLSQAA